MKKLLYLGFCLALVSCASKRKLEHISHYNPVPAKVKLSEYKNVQLRPGQDKEKAVAMAFSGGGTRAAFFGLGALQELENLKLNDNSNALQQIDYMSSVSGGGLAAGYYISTLYDYNLPKKSPLTASINLTPTTDSVYSFHSKVRKDYVEELDISLESAIIVPTLWRPLSFLFTRYNTSTALEKKIDRRVLGSRLRRNNSAQDKTHEIKHRDYSITLGDMFIQKSIDKNPQLPILVANSTVMSNSFIFPFAPNVLKEYGVNGCFHWYRRYECRDNGKGEKATLDPYSVPLSVGVKASGSFPVMIRNTSLFTPNYLDKKSLFIFRKNYNFIRLADGGVADNLGGFTAINLLEQDPQVKKRVLIVLDADAGGVSPVYNKTRRGVFAGNISTQMSSGLDARYATVDEQIKAMCSTKDINEPIFLRFSTFRPTIANPSPEGKFKRRKEAQKILTSYGVAGNKTVFEIELNKISDTDKQLIFEISSQAATRYNLDSEDKQILILAGRLAVHSQKENIKSQLN